MVQQDDRGFTVLDVVCASVVVAVLALLLMPALASYQATATMRQAGVRAVADIREARELAVTEHVPILVYIHTVSTEGWQVIQSPCARADTCRGPEGQVLYQYAVPAPDHVTGYCYVTTFGSDGQAYPVGCAAGSAQNPTGNVATVLCIDNGAGAQAEQVQIQITLATGQVQEVPGPGVCT